MKTLKTDHAQLNLCDNLYWEVFFDDDVTLDIESITEILDLIADDSVSHPVLIHSENVFGVDFQSLEFISQGHHPALDRLHVLIVDTNNMSQRYMKALMSLKSEDKNIVPFDNTEDAKAYILAHL